MPMFICFISYWLIGLCVGMSLAFVADFGAAGLWWGLVLGLAAAAVLLTLRFRHSAAPANRGPSRRGITNLEGTLPASFSVPRDHFEIGCGP